MSAASSMPARHQALARECHRAGPHRVSCYRWSIPGGAHASEYSASTGIRSVKSRISALRCSCHVDPRCFHPLPAGWPAAQRSLSVVGTHEDTPDASSKAPEILWRWSRTLPKRSRAEGRSEGRACTQDAGAGTRRTRATTTFRTRSPADSPSGNFLLSADVRRRPSAMTYCHS